jgi:hypothetical protein
MLCGVCMLDYVHYSQDPSTTSSPALANERKVDHEAIIIEVINSHLYGDSMPM